MIDMLVCDDRDIPKRLEPLEDVRELYEGLFSAMTTRYGVNGTELFEHIVSPVKTEDGLITVFRGGSPTIYPTSPLGKVLGENGYNLEFSPDEHTTVDGINYQFHRQNKYVRTNYGRVTTAPQRVQMKIRMDPEGQRGPVATYHDSAWFQNQNIGYGFGAQFFETVNEFDPMILRLFGLAVMDGTEHIMHMIIPGDPEGTVHAGHKQMIEALKFDDMMMPDGTRHNGWQVFCMKALMDLRQEELQSSSEVDTTIWKNAKLFIELVQDFVASDTRAVNRLRNNFPKTGYQFVERVPKRKNTDHFKDTVYEILIGTYVQFLAQAYGFTHEYVQAIRDHSGITTPNDELHNAITHKSKIVIKLPNREFAILSPQQVFILVADSIMDKKSYRPDYDPTSEIRAIALNDGHLVDRNRERLRK